MDKEMLLGRFSRGPGGGTSPMSSLLDIRDYSVVDHLRMIASMARQTQNRGSLPGTTPGLSAFGLVCQT